MLESEEEQVKNIAQEPYTDLLAAREDARMFSRPKAEAHMLRAITNRLKKSDPDFIQPVLKNLLENFDNLITEAYDQVFEITDYVINHSGDISKIIPPLSLLVGNRSPEIRAKSTAFLCSIGPHAKMAEDMAMGCLRNNAADIRLCGAKILYSIGSACSRSITRQLINVTQRFKEEREFCALLLGTVKRINSCLGNNNDPSKQNGQNGEPGKATAVLTKLAAVFKDKRVLLAEDNGVLRDTIEEMLKTKLGMQVYAAADGLQAQEILASLSTENTLPDYIILDLKMPELNGVHVLSGIRRNANTRDIPVIVVTAVVDARIIETIEKLGVSSYLKKPFRINDLIKAMAGTTTEQTQRV